MLADRLDRPAFNEGLDWLNKLPEMQDEFIQRSLAFLADDLFLRDVPINVSYVLEKLFKV